jgi:hypothetical protein
MALFFAAASMSLARAMKTATVLNGSMTATRELMAMNAKLEIVNLLTRSSQFVPLI